MSSTIMHTRNITKSFPLQCKYPISWANIDDVIDCLAIFQITYQFYAIYFQVINGLE